MQFLKSRSAPGHVSITLILSYVLDWVTIILAAGVGGAFSFISPNKRPFSLENPDISFPFVQHEKISTVVLVICSLLAPAIIIVLVSLLLVPGPTVPKTTPKALVWRRKLWEWHTGWLGLALSVASAWLITNGIKNLIGKPRPDLLSRCDPDFTNANLYAVGGFNGTSTLVSHTICQNTDGSMIDDGFRSFPSGHASFSAAGLIYLSLFLASKLNVTTPALSPQSVSDRRSRLAAFKGGATNEPVNQNGTAMSGAQSSSQPVEKPAEASDHNAATIAAQNCAAAPPVYLLVFVVIPWFASIYISSTRFSDFRHHGFDILFGYFIGTATAVFAFRFYHLPIRQGAGWSWGPRSRARSFWAGVGIGNYVNTSPRQPEGVADLERGSAGR